MNKYHKYHILLSYLADEFLWPSDLEARGRLRSASLALIVRRTRTVLSSTVGAYRVCPSSPLPVSRTNFAVPVSFLQLVRRLIFSVVPFPTFCIVHMKRLLRLANYRTL